MELSCNGSRMVEFWYRNVFRHYNEKLFQYGLRCP
ncbi:hypothetical protein T03_14263 [Trichinella britovi]|uniref:Uncharacterized protein n=1 Tax=Trichinella britovi TaxID=45882 RepID=A0A0V0YX05_TRIBR|nr:hypothetical protein T03_14263 [Trichinella britovi]